MEEEPWKAWVMNFFKAQIDRLGRQVAALNASQKMLAGALLAIMVMTLVMWGKYASSPEMEAVLDQPMSPEEIARTKDFLTGRGYMPKVVGDRVMVAAERRLEAFSDLSFNQLLPRDTTSAFDAILNKMSPWDSAGKQEVMWNQMKEMHLAQVMSSWPGVSQAHVMIDQKEKHGLMPSSPSAMVDLRTRGGEQRGEKQLVAAAVALVKGAVSGIDPTKISVIIDGVSRRVQDNSTGSYIADELGLRQEAENRYAENIRERLSYIEGLVVAVTAEVNTKSIRQESTEVNPKNTVQKETKTTSKSEENSSGSSGGEPGAGANTQAQVAEGSSDKGKSSTSEETNEFKVEIGKTVTESTEGPGRATIRSATVGVPRSYLKRIYKELYPNDKDFVQANFDLAEKKELDSITKTVKAAVNLTDGAMVVVDSYVDATPAMLASAQAVSTSTTTLGVNTAALGGHVREIGAGALALISLFMVTMMVKKGTVPSVPTPSASGAAMPFEVGEPEAREVGAAGAMLDAMELDDESVKTQEIIGQVSTLVRENPDAAATLVKRWLNR